MAQDCATEDRHPQYQKDDCGPSWIGGFRSTCRQLSFPAISSFNGVRILNSRPEPAHEGHFLGLFARAGTGDTSFNWSSAVRTLCQRTLSFFVSIGAERLE